MADWIDVYPEWEPVDRGDPYLTEIVKADDAITDNEDNAAIVAWIERVRLSYELTALFRWWSL